MGVRKIFRKKLTWRLKSKDSGWHTIDQIGSYENGFSLEIIWNIRGKHKTLGNLQEMSILAFSHPILLRGVNTRTYVDNPMVLKVGIETTSEVF